MTDPDLLADEMKARAARFGDIDVITEPQDDDEILMFIAFLDEPLADADLRWLCRTWAELIRKNVSGRPDDWSSAIVFAGPGHPIGTYHLGWAGHEDDWYVPDIPPETSSEEWDALYERLDAYLGLHGTSDSQGGGDYFLYDEESGHADQALTIYRIEFLTPALVRGIQAILQDGYAGWMVYVVLDLLPPVEGISSDGLEIHADRVVETWDRAIMVARVGERLKV